MNIIFTTPFCKKSLEKIFSAIVIISLLITSITSPVQAAELQDNNLKIAGINNSKENSYEPCVLSDGTNRLSVDNSIGGGAGRGCLIDYSQFPSVRVRIENSHGFWTKIALFDNYNDVSVTPENIWANFGYIAPNQYAEYTLVFDSSYNSRVMFFLNAAQSEDGRPTAGLLNVISKILGILNIEIVSAQLGDLQYVLQALEDSQHITLAADALTRLDLPLFLLEFNNALGDEWDLNVIKLIAARFGKTVSISLLKTIFTAYKILVTSKDTWETVWAIVTGSYAGTVTIISQVQGVPLPPSSTPTVPPLSTPTPLSTSDIAVFIGDITYPDGTSVSPGQALTKTWRIKNSGTSTWNGYKLKFTNGEQMGGPAEITIPTTSPGQTRDITINLVAPSSSGVHSGSWQIVNSQGSWVTGGKLWVKINVGAQSGVITLTTDPSSPASASQVNIYARVNNFANLRALRILVDGQQLCELGAPEIKDCVWHTNGYATGQHSIVAEADDSTGSSWDNPERKTILFELTGSAVTNHGPYRPMLVQNPAYDWYVTIGNAPQLCAQQQGDPDGNPVNQYRFFASASVGTADSGWVGSSCYTFGSITPGTYEWHAQVKDSLGGISDWSDSWHFTVEPSGIDTYIDHFSVGSPSNAEQIKVFACTTGHAGINIAMRVLVNEANNGSDSGEWRIIKEQGSPCFIDNDAPVWNTLGYEDGPHLVRVVAWASQPDAGDIYDTVFTLNHRRPYTPQLVAPIPTSGNNQEAIYLNSRTVTFKWESTIRATTYTLHVSTNPSPKDDPTPILRQTFNSNIVEHTVTLGQDYPNLYWQVTATNDIGSNDSGAQRFGIDRLVPACTVPDLPTKTYANVFQVNWNSTDNLAGIKTADIQVMDSERGTWEDWLTNIPFNKTYDLFDGQPGHIYFFRCRATDNANNTGNYPASANTSITIDPFTRPGTPWWDAAYGQKRNIVILNNMGSTPLPQNYPIHLHFDNSTTPTASTLYAASLSSTKCNDLRVIYGDAIELDRVVQKCTSSAIDIWFRSQVSLTGGSSNNSSHQLYYGNSNAGSPPANQGNVFYPTVDANTVGAWYMNEGQGSVLNDLSGNGHNCTIYSPTSWIFPTKFPGALNFSGGSDSQTVNCGASSAYNLQSFTFETYFRSTNNSAWGRMAGHIQPSSQRWILETLDNKPSLWIWTTNGDVRINVNQTYNDNLWHHLAFTINGTQVKIYIDGQLKTTGNLPGNIRSDNLPLTIGSTENIMRTFNEITGVRLSNIVRTDFSYGAFVNILNEPSIATDSVVTPPVTGSPDLSILSLSTYPNPDGGALIEAVVENQGDLNTESGFYTDLYLNHLPTGAGDYSNSLSFWINDPIGPGETVTLTTVISDVSSISPTSTQSIQILNATGSFSESSGTLYVQTDSAGLVEEPDNQNNIYETGVQVCTATTDSFEGDDIYTAAILIATGASQTHNFDVPGDQDWIKFNALSGKNYRIVTSALGISADTYLYLYDTDGTTLISSNDDYNDSLVSQVEWTAPQNGTYYILVKHWNPNVGGCGTSYNIKLEEILSNSPHVSSIIRTFSSPTSLASVDFTATFSEAVQNVDVNDFSLTAPGISNPSITNVTPVSASIYTVTVNTGSRNGTIRLDVPDTATITDLAGNPLGGLPYADGEVYTITKFISSTFGDVPSNHPYLTDIEILYANGLTAGCSSSPLLFCPDTVMDRAQSAVFMLRGNLGVNYAPPNPPFGSTFGDYWGPGPWAQKWAQGMLQQGLTAGCSSSPLLYCPWEAMPRLQAAVFGMRLMNGNAYVPPPATGTVFADLTDTSLWYTKWAEQAYLNGLLPACGSSGGKPLFCPNDLVSRGLGAYMIVRAKNLTMP